MRSIFTLLLSFTSLIAGAQDMTGIWRGSFISSDKKMMDLFNVEDKYKYEIQLDQANKGFTGVTYSYKTTVFYGKASAKGTINPATGKVRIEEIRLLELKMSPDSYACWMVCMLQYTKNGDEEFLEGRYSSYRETDSAFCDRGTVFLKRVSNSDFYKEPFLVKREQEKEKLDALRNKPVHTNPANTAIAKTNTPKPNNAPRTNPPAKPAAKTGNPAVAKKKTEAPLPPQIKQAESTPGEIKTVPLTANVQPDKKPKEPLIIPSVLKNRDNELVQTITVNSTDITIDIYDNGTIDHDTISVFLDKKNIVNHEMLKATPIIVKLKMDENNDYHELVMVADNLGDIPPNTSLMVVKAGDKQYEVRIASTEQKNAVVIFRYEKPH